MRDTTTHLHLFKYNYSRTAPTCGNSFLCNAKSFKHSILNQSNSLRSCACAHESSSQNSSSSVLESGVSIFKSRQSSYCSSLSHWLLMQACTCEIIFLFAFYYFEALLKHIATASVTKLLALSLSLMALRQANRNENSNLIFFSGSRLTWISK